jgi:hypothetical protein
VETQQKELTLEERQANIHRLIARWKERKKQIEEEALEFRKTPEYQAAMEDLRREHQKNGSRVAKV